MDTQVQYRLVRSDGASWTVDEGERLSLGRSRQNVVQIADSAVSRVHATLLVARGRCWIRDENSTHGTYINGQRVMGQQELREGDVLQIGPATFRLVAVPVYVSVARQRQRDVALPPARRQRQSTLLVALSAVVIVVLVIAVSFGSFTSTDRTSPEPVEPRESTVLTSGPIDVEPDGTAQVELYDGTQATLHFVDDGESVEDVEATYVSDETGVTVVAVPQDGEHFPAIRFFPGQQARRLSPGLASPLRQGVTDLTIDFEQIVFDEAVLVETAFLNPEHLENLPSNMPEWERKAREDRHSICKGGSAGATAIVIVHTILHPPTGIPHAILYVSAHVLIHTVGEGACEELFEPEDPAAQYVGAINRDLSLGIYWPDSQNMEHGFVVGQVVDGHTQDGIPGAAVNADDSDARTYNTTTFSNGWYRLTLSGGSHTISAQAEGYNTNSIDVEVEAATAELADPISLTPGEQTQAPECPHQVLTVRGTVQEASSDLVVLKAVEVIEGRATTPADLTEVWVEDIPSGVPMQAGANVEVRGFMIYHLPDVQGLSVEKEGCTGGYFKVLESSPPPESDAQLGQPTITDSMKRGVGGNNSFDLASHTSKSRWEEMKADVPSDYNSAYPPPNIRWTVDWGDGDVVDSGWVTSGAYTTPWHQWATFNGEETVTATLTDRLGRTDTFVMAWTH